MMHGRLLLIAFLTFASASAVRLSAEEAPQALAAAKAIEARRPAPQSGPYSWDTGAYAYDGAGNIIGIGDQAFGYDLHSRLTYAKVVAPGTWTEQSFAYDVYGNMTSRSTGGIPTAIGIDSGTNRLNAANPQYDAAGNLTQWQPAASSHVYKLTYDALNMVTEERIDSETSPHVTYVYTADDERIAVEDRVTNTAHWKIRGLDQKVLRDYQVSGTTWTVFRDYVYRGGPMLAAITPATVEHFSLDHLGTPRLITDQAGNKIGFHTYLPFGEEIGAGAQEGEPLKFTGHERDADPANDINPLDYMHARYYAESMGRFLSVDPVVDTKAAAANPQLWNAYAYVQDRPLTATDPDGRVEALVYGQTKNVHPGDVLLLVSRKDRKAKHVVIVAGFVKNKKGGLDAVVYENVPRSEQGRSTLKDNVSGPMIKVNSNDPSAGAGMWNADNLMVGAVFHNAHWGLFPFREAQIDRAAAAVGSLTYWNQSRGGLGLSCDCTGGVDQMLKILGGNLRGVGLGGPRSLDSWENKARWGALDPWD
ncbi:MAG TPA: RHS repeat-associated core domain-containing protein [Thermoanaerobaculia bacterium]|nr:RHS repeat-associated core domain-containing protein [Thermoanaerobaculia bacterium]